MNEQTTMFDDNPEYQTFVDKFKRKKTTDDCYTPPLVYEAIKEWACKEYGIDPALIVRPFYPNGDYERFDYSGGKVVLDNSPFSILAKIQTFYLERGIPFFLFAPSLTALTGKKNVMNVCHIVPDANITYENGAVVRTAFITNIDKDIVLRTAPDLGAAIDKAMTATLAATKKTVPKYEYPYNVVTAALMQRYSHWGIDFRIRRENCTYIDALDAQRAVGKAIFGGGLLLSERAAAERAAAERAAAEKWQLSPRELEVVKRLGAIYEVPDNA